MTERALLHRWLLAVCVCLAAPLGAQPRDAGDARAETRERFVSAYRAAGLGIAGPADDEQLRTYVLYPYVRAARIERELGRAGGPWQAADEAAAEFLGEHGTAPVGIALRRAWLASLARRELWQAFADRYDSRTATTGLECQRLSARIALADTADLAPMTLERWLTPHQLPIECEPAFAWLRAQSLLPPDLVARRVELLLDAGRVPFARVIARPLPPTEAAPLLARAAAIERPAQAIDALLASPGDDGIDDVLRDAWPRLARSDPAGGLARFAPLSARAQDSAHAQKLALDLALGLAWDRRPEALDLFARVAPDHLDDYALEWHARAALWAGDWRVAADAIAAMSPALRSSSAWRYWAARAAAELDGRAAARELYASVVGDDNYYSALAAARLGDRVVPRAEPLAADPAKVDRIAARTPFARARELALTGLRDLATLEWHHGYAALSDDLRPQAVHLAARWELHDIAVATATSLGIFNDYALLYPFAHADAVAAAAKLAGLERHVLFGLLRQESLFRWDAASPSGAVGIAQLTPDTARRVARRWQLPAPGRGDLFDAPTSITLGAAHLADLVDAFDGQLPVALAAYNAGANAARRWLPERAIDADVWVENIPYNETRAYVRRVLWHGLVFEWLDSGRPQNAREWLDEIEP